MCVPNPPLNYDKQMVTPFNIYKRKFEIMVYGKTKYNFTSLNFTSLLKDKISILAI